MSVSIFWMIKLTSFSKQTDVILTNVCVKWDTIRKDRSQMPCRKVKVNSHNMNNIVKWIQIIFLTLWHFCGRTEWLITQSTIMAGDNFCYISLPKNRWYYFIFNARNRKSDHKRTSNTFFRLVPFLLSIWTHLTFGSTLRFCIEIAEMYPSLIFTMFQLCRNCVT